MTLGVAYVKGLQGPISRVRLRHRLRQAHGGRQPNGERHQRCAERHGSRERTLREAFCRRSKSASRRVVYTVMAARQRVRRHSRPRQSFLLTDTRAANGASDGLWVSDWMDIERMQDYHTTG